MGDTPHKWYVIYNKSPLGPLDDDEVQAMIDKGLLRLNDAAFQVGPDEKPLSDWKMLWQYPQFNRRTGEERREKTPTPPPSGTAQKPPEEKREKSGERRQSLTDDEAKARLMELLPEQIAEIDPEELISGTTHKKPPEILSQAIHEDGEVSELPPLDVPNTTRSLPSTWVAGIMGIALIALAAYFFTSPSPPSKSQPNRTVAKKTKPPRTRTRNRSVRRSKPKPEARPEARRLRPVQRDEPREDSRYDSEGDEGYVDGGEDPEFEEFDDQDRKRSARSPFRRRGQRNRVPGSNADEDFDDGVAQPEEGFDDGYDNPDDGPVDGDGDPEFEDEGY